MTSWICLRHGISSYRSFADNSLIQKDSVVPFDRILLSLFCRYRDIAIDSDNSHEGYEGCIMLSCYELKSEEYDDPFDILNNTDWQSECKPVLFRLD